MVLANNKTPECVWQTRQPRWTSYQCFLSRRQPCVDGTGHQKLNANIVLPRSVCDTLTETDWLDWLIWMGDKNSKAFEWGWSKIRLGDRTRLTIGNIWEVGKQGLNWEHCMNQSDCWWPLSDMEARLDRGVANLCKQTVPDMKSRITTL